MMAFSQKSGPDRESQQPIIINSFCVKVQLMIEDTRGASAFSHVFFSSSREAGSPLDPSSYFYVPLLFIKCRVQ